MVGGTALTARFVMLPGLAEGDAVRHCGYWRLPNGLTVGLGNPNSLRLRYRNSIHELPPRHIPVLLGDFGPGCPHRKKKRARCWPDGSLHVSSTSRIVRRVKVAPKPPVPLHMVIVSLQTLDFQNIIERFAAFALSLLQ